MYYYLYKITNIINKKIYIGVHKTFNLNDNYFGSGKILCFAIKKYGKENFIKEILQFFNSEKEMYNSEYIIVNEDFINRIDTYNLKIGGFGGWDYANKNHKNIKNSRYGIKLSNELKLKISKSIKKIMKDEKIKKKISLGHKKFFENGGIGAFLNKKHTEETKQKIGKANSIHQSGKNNNQYGTMWIYNDELKQSKKIKNTEEIPYGWKKGRKIKF